MNDLGAAGRPHQLAMGMRAVLLGGGSVSTVVGAGLAVVVLFPGGRGGGLVHLHALGTGSGAREPIFDARSVTLLQRFLGELERLEVTLDRARCELVGGAESAGGVTREHRAWLARARVEGIRAMLARRHEALTERALGGRHRRRVELDTASGTIDVHFVAEGTADQPGGVRARVGLADERALRPTMVHMGQLVVGRAPQLLGALLGSCVGVALVDQAAGIGGLAHVVLPRSPGPSSEREPGKYADTAVPALRDAVREAGGTRRLVALLAGGGNTLFAEGEQGVWRIPRSNVEVVREALDAAGIPVVRAEVGGRIARKMIVDLAQAQMHIKILADRSGAPGATPARE